MFGPPVLSRRGCGSSRLFVSRVCVPPLAVFPRLAVPSVGSLDRRGRPRRPTLLSHPAFPPCEIVAFKVLSQGFCLIPIFGMEPHSIS